MPNGSIQCLWPDHCVQNSFGAEIVDGLLRAPSDYVVHKGTNPDVDSYSALYDNNRAASTGLGEQLKDAGVSVIVGWAMRVTTA